MPQNDQRADGYTIEQLLQKCQAYYHFEARDVYQLKGQKEEYALMVEATPSEWMKERNPINRMPPWNNFVLMPRCNKENLLKLNQQIKSVLQAK